MERSSSRRALQSAHVPSRLSILQSIRETVTPYDHNSKSRILHLCQSRVHLYIDTYLFLQVKSITVSCHGPTWHAAGPSRNCGMARGGLLASQISLSLTLTWGICKSICTEASFPGCRSFRRYALNGNTQKLNETDTPYCLNTSEKKLEKHDIWDVEMWNLLGQQQIP